VLGIGAAAVFAVLSLCLVVVAHRSLIRRAGPRGAGRAPTLAGRLRLQPVPATGARFALDGRADGRRAPVLLTVGTAAVAAALVTGALVVSSSIDRVLSVPHASGSPWDGFASQTGEPEDADLEHARQLATDPRVTATARIGQGPLLAAMPGNDGEIWAIGIEPVRGEIEPTVLSGRAPTGPDEVLVSRAVRDEFHLGLGDQLLVRGGDGAHALRVVGIGLLPIVNEETNAWAVVVPLQTLAELGGFTDFSRSESGIAYRVKDRADLDDVNRAAEALVADATIALRARIPGKVTSLGEVDELPVVLAALVGVLGLLTIGFGLVLAVRQRRHELGVLRALGFRPGDARGAVHWQAIVTALAGLGAGVPVGVVVGRQVWTLIAGVVDADPAPVVSARTLAVVACTVVAAGLALSIGPAWRAGRFAPAASLRSE
jgi:ABC-type lipoprotein release transport system permease subunit